MSDATPTRAAVLELQDEGRAMREGYAFLDEKRLLLVAEMLRELRAWEQTWARFEAAHARAGDALRAAIGRHGLQGLEVYPPPRLERCELETGERSLLGVRLQQARLHAEATPAADAPNPSPEAAHCTAAFVALLDDAAVLAALGANLERLRREYRRTERRARALEDVLIPEVEQALHEMESHLEEIEQEEAVRVRLA